MVRIELDDFGTRYVGEPTHPCDILAATSVIPPHMKSPATKKIEDYVKNEIGYNYSCYAKKECRVTFFNGNKFARNPSYSSWKFTFGYIVGDCGYSLQSIPATKEHGEKLVKLADELKDEELLRTDSERLNKEINNHWVNRWYNLYAWDFNEEEREQLKNPFIKKEE